MIMTDHLKVSFVVSARLTIRCLSTVASHRLAEALAGKGATH